VATSPQPTSAILIADGDAATRKKLARLLESAGFATAQASTGQEALDFLQSDPPPAAILESSLAGVLGYEVCRALRDQFGEAVSTGIAAFSSARPKNLARAAQTT